MPLPLRDHALIQTDFYVVTTFGGRKIDTLKLKITHYFGLITGASGIKVISNYNETIKKLFPLI